MEEEFGDSAGDYVGEADGEEVSMVAAEEVAGSEVKAVALGLPETPPAEESPAGEGGASEAPCVPQAASSAAPAEARVPPTRVRRVTFEETWCWRFKLPPEDDLLMYSVLVLHY